jgi:hypothetical protein
VERHTREARAVLQLTGDFELVTVGLNVWSSERVQRRN